MKCEYNTQGTCSSKIQFEIDNGRIHNVAFTNGCNGNLKALAILVENMEPKELLEKLQGLRCGARPTSCADQLARAVKQFTAL